MSITRAGTPCFALLVLAAVGCTTDSGEPTATVHPPLAYVRYINALPDTMNTTVRWVDFLEYTPMTFASVAYRGIGQGLYQGLKAGARHFRVFNADVVNYSVAGNTAVLADTTHTFEAGKYYTILFTGYARTGSRKIKVFEDVIPSPGSNIAVRVLNANTGLGAIDAYKVAATSDPITGAAVFASVAEQAFSAYVTMAPGALAIRATAAGATTVLASGAATSGTAGTTSADPIGGALVAGTVLTAMVFPASVPGSMAASAPTPSVVWVVDKQPPRTTVP